MTGHHGDITAALRIFRRQPAFTTIAVLTLALSIGATTAIFSVVNGIVLRPLPFFESERLVRVFERNEARGWTTFGVAPANFVDWARHTKTIGSMAALRADTAALSFESGADQVPAVLATAELFTVLEARPALGRTFAVGDDAPGAAPVAVIGHGLWQRRFGGDPAVVGRAVAINDRRTTVVGVMPRGFGEAEPAADIWLPLTLDRANPERGGRSLGVIGRLRDGATVEGARAELTTLAGTLARQYPAENGGWSITLVGLEETAVQSGVKRGLFLLLFAVSLVLLIGCVNVANLLSARGVARQREFAVRAALGGGRWRLVRQLLTESLVLGLGGGALGILLAIWATELLLAMAPAGIPRLNEVRIDGRVLGVGLMVTLAATFFFGMAPALQLSAARPDDALKEAAQRGTMSPSRRRSSQAFVVAEVALAIVLLVGAGLLLRSFTRLMDQSLGFDPERALTFNLSLPESRYPTPESVTAFYDRSLERMRSLPGVVAAGGTHALPFSGRDSVRPFVRADEPADLASAPTSEYRLVTPGYFRAMGVPMQRGREFTDRDGAGRPGSIIVNEAFVAQYLRGEPLGQRIRQGGNPNLPWLTVVGVAGNVRHSGLDAVMGPEMYWPEAQATWGATLNRHRRTMTIVVRTSVEPAQLLPSIRALIAEIDPHRPLVDPRPMRELVWRSGDMARFSTLLLGIFSVTGLVLASAGVFGVMSYSVNARRREMGIRLALGARPRALLLDVLIRGALLVSLGGLAGLGGAWVLGDALRLQLFQTPPHDALTFGCATGLLMVTALAACWVPARRAARLDPITALRD